MSNNKLLHEFAEKVKERKTEIIELKNQYLIKQIQNEMVQKRFNDIRNKVLEAGLYCAESTHDERRNGKVIKAGDRIINYCDDFLLSDKDFDEYQSICAKEFYKAGLTDASGCYTKDTDTKNQLNEIKDKLISLSVEILPEDFPDKEILENAIKFKCPNSFEIREKLFGLIMQLKV